jgi:hypothetical protein
VGVGAAVSKANALQDVVLRQSRLVVAVGALNWNCVVVTHVVIGLHARLDVGVGAIDWYCDEVQLVKGAQARLVVAVSGSV